MKSCKENSFGDQIALFLSDKFWKVASGPEIKWLHPADRD